MNRRIYVTILAAAVGLVELLFYLGFLAQSPLKNTEWHGGALRPHTTKDIRKLKKALSVGPHMMLRDQLDLANAKQGPHERKRCSGDGVAISVIPVNTESNSLAKRIYSEIFVYIAWNGAGRPLYATVSEYQIFAPSSDV